MPMRKGKPTTNRSKTNGGSSSKSSGSSSSKSSGGRSGGSSSSGGSRTPTTVWDSSGASQQGYIQNGKTYYNNGQRISDGSRVVDNSGREWVMQGGQGVSTGVSFGIGGNPGAYYQNQNGGNGRQEAYDNSYQNELNRRYEELQRQQEEARRLAIEQGVNRLETNRGTINQGYDDTARQAYVQKMQSQQNLPQMLAGQGITGGGSESAQIALDTSYGNNVAMNERGRQGALTGLDNSIADLRSSGDLSIAESALALNQQKMQDWQNAYAQKIQQDNFLKEFNQNKENNARQEAINTIGAHSQDYQAYINRLQNDGDPSNDYLIPYAQMARQQKLAEMAASQAQQEQTDYDRWHDQERLDISWHNALKTPAKKSSKSKSSSMTQKQYLSSLLGK